jgi:transcriptional regulator with XRE-family HTH domain
MDIDYVKKVMKERKITYEELAKMTNLSISAIKKILSGIAKYPRIDTVEAIEKALGLQNEKTPPQLSDGEQKLIELFRLVPQDQQDLVLSMINGAIESLNNN